jgi:hypothetical protein
LRLKVKAPAGAGALLFVTTSIVENGVELIGTFGRFIWGGESDLFCFGWMVWGGFAQGLGA